jgi:hypothetical protein
MSKQFVLADNCRLTTKLSIFIALDFPFVSEPVGRVRLPDLEEGPALVEGERAANTACSEHWRHRTLFKF